jgi:hypothetical protein
VGVRLVSIIISRARVPEAAVAFVDQRAPQIPHMRGAQSRTDAQRADLQRRGFFFGYVHFRTPVSVAASAESSPYIGLKPTPIGVPRSAQVRRPFGKLTERRVWRSEFETLDQASREIAIYIHSYHYRPHSGLRYRKPTEVRQTWEDGQRLAKAAA